MNARTFNLIDTLNREGFDNSRWGLTRLNTRANTADTFGTDESKVIPAGEYLYVYIQKDELLNFFVAEPDYKMSVYKEGKENVYLFKLD